jgi:hypothetical protein
MPVIIHETVCATDRPASDATFANNTNAPVTPKTIAVMPAVIYAGLILKSLTPPIHPIPDSKKPLLLIVYSIPEKGCLATVCI